MISGGVYLTQGFDQNLLILTEAAFHEVFLRVSSLNIADPLVRSLSRMILSRAFFMKLGSKNVISLPADLMEYANLNEELVLVGQGNYLEIWSPDQWEQQKAQINDAKTNAHRFSTFTISTH